MVHAAVRGDILVIMVTIRMRPKEGKMDIVLRTVRRLLEPTRAQPSCQSFRCLRDIEDESVIVLEERWETRKDSERHVRSDGFRTILSLLDECGEEPVVEFHEVTATDGIDKVGELRGLQTQTDDHCLVPQEVGAA